MCDMLRLPQTIDIGSLLKAFQKQCGFLDCGTHKLWTETAVEFERLWLICERENKKIHKDALPKTH